MIWYAFALIWQHCNVTLPTSDITVTSHVHKSVSNHSNIILDWSYLHQSCVIWGAWCCKSLDCTFNDMSRSTAEKIKNLYITGYSVELSVDSTHKLPVIRIGFPRLDISMNIDNHSRQNMMQSGATKKTSAPVGFMLRDISTPSFMPWCLQKTYTPSFEYG